MSASYTIAPLEQADLPACARAIHTAYEHDEYVNTIYPKHLQHLNTTEEDRIQRLAELVGNELAASTVYTVLKATSDSGDGERKLVGFICLKHDYKPTGQETSPSLEEPTAASSEKASCIDTADELAQERDETASNIINAAFDRLKQNYLPGPAWSIQRLAVKPGFQRQGIATSLVKAAVKLLRMKDPAMPIYLGSTIKAEKVYENAGFEKVGEVAYEPKAVAENKPERDSETNKDGSKVIAEDFNSKSRDTAEAAGVVYRWPFMIMKPTEPDLENK